MEEFRDLLTKLLGTEGKSRVLECLERLAYGNEEFVELISLAKDPSMIGLDELRRIGSVYRGYERLVNINATYPDVFFMRCKEYCDPARGGTLDCGKLCLELKRNLGEIRKEAWRMRTLEIYRKLRDESHEGLTDQILEDDAEEFYLVLRGIDSFSSLFHGRGSRHGEALQRQTVIIINDVLLMAYLYARFHLSQC
ncbi:hypothetical protein [Metallosphaera javensis (ex Sakai et al. 2022)]|uniref:hypothetical protein n=1 Tax=Metallosphaera javensis (ex Sakai et al. 2022) TaxID=2775498 RepID=UPI002590EB15|nr:MAG: hypothetical protein MjAS7_1899 [Metallosphaera javensis (ex Sakai et al. 2022)]